MNEVTQHRFIKFLTLVTYAIMITLNALANILPINGLNTGQISDSYPNLFAPIGLTFGIWGVIYLLLAIHTLYFLGVGYQKGTPLDTMLPKIGLLFSVSSLANAVWILAWHYQMIGVSVILMLVILVCLAQINIILSKLPINNVEFWTVKIPFGTYFGWITVATIANITTYLVSLDWNGFGVDQAVWTIIILFIGAAIGTTTLIKTQNVAYGLVLIWAYAGIIMKHLSPAGFNGDYTWVIAAAGGSILVFVLGLALVLANQRAIRLGLTR